MDPPPLPHKTVVILHATACLPPMDETAPELLRRQITSRFDHLGAWIREHGGLVHEHLGDEMMAEFEDPDRAVLCALGAQASLGQWGEDAPIRIGLNLGEVIIDRGSIWGPGIVRAQRVEQLATPGGVCVNHTVRDAVEETLPVRFEDLGERRVKNTDVHAYRVELLPNVSMSEPRRVEAAPSAAVGRPAVAIVPLALHNGDTRLEGLAERITSGLNTALGQFQTFPVVPPRQTATYDGANFDSRQIARDHGAGWVVGGTLRQMGGQVRVTLELIDPHSHTAVWTNRYSGRLDDEETLVEEMIDCGAAMLEAEIERAELRQPLPIPDLARTWHLLRRGLWHQYRLTRDDAQQALRYFEQARAQDPESVDVLVHVAWWHWWHGATQRNGDRNPWQALGECIDELRALAPDDARTRVLCGAHHLMLGRPGEAREHLEFAARTNPRYADAHSALAASWSFSGEPARGLEHARRALRLSPYRFGAFHSHGEAALASYLLGDWEPAIVAADDALRLRPGYWLAHVVRTGALARSGAGAGAAEALRALLAQRGDAVEQDLRWIMFEDAEWNDYLREGLVIAGWQPPS